LSFNKIYEIFYIFKEKKFYFLKYIYFILALYSQLIEEEQRLSDFMNSLNKDSQSRIYKTNQIKENWSEKLNELSSQDPITIDYSVYPDQKNAVSDIFGRIFNIINLGNDDIYKSNVILIINL